MLKKQMWHTECYHIVRALSKLEGHPLALIQVIDPYLSSTVMVVFEVAYLGCSDG